MVACKFLLRELAKAMSRLGETPTSAFALLNPTSFLSEPIISSNTQFYFLLQPIAEHKACRLWFSFMIKQVQKDGPFVFPYMRKGDEGFLIFDDKTLDRSHNRSYTLHIQISASLW
jgi:hypothetical protein